ncbi:hypothetical protein AM493_17390 [Flavobacterium akiainvivens]|uniref:Uncharacterized protein n=2 Tax=Flavobacterium akiainvivens TaxID=1202724 RepID=A0A0M9VJB9_9FLAO|nr:hypothetical protein AM493_17390 [Flavobacterium akiainvivens]SFQ22787.1 gliding motility-associated C-terminal domain-containing protein [Flavobacterium akiainvivens]
MFGLPGGNYTYSLMLEGCPEPVTGTMNVVPYQETGNTVEVIPNCGSFDLYLQHQSNSATTFTGFWLQRYDENLGLWVHPGTGASGGDDVGYFNAILLNNGTTNYSLPYTGQFRVVKRFSVYGHGSSNNTCYTVLYEFTFTGAPQIEAAYGFPCDNGLAEVIVVANGVEPLTYQITSKNGQPFVVDNGTSNVFTGLEKAVYNFRVTDNCGNLVNVLYDVSVLEFIEIEAGSICNGQPVQLWLPEFTFLLYEWYKSDDPDTILSTSHTLNISSFNPETDSGLYIVHVESVTPGSCIDTLLEYNAIGTALPQAGNDVETALCGLGNVLNLSVYLSGDYDAGGYWQDAAFTGALNGSMLNTALLNPGSYVFYYTVAQCDVTDTAQITLHLLENDNYPVVLEGKCTGDSYIISIINMEDIGATQQIEWQGPGGYSHTGNDYFIDVTGLPEGEYSAEVINADGCTSQAASWFERTDCTMPRGISPNGDEFNNNFDLSNFDVKYLVIFNRYGLKVYEANNYIDEWHGQSDKGELPTGTYYYMVSLEDGTQRTGWVYLQREVK